jgi:hypothetical protein
MVFSNACGFLRFSMESACLGPNIMPNAVARDEAAEGLKVVFDPRTSGETCPIKAAVLQYEEQRKRTSTDAQMDEKESAILNSCLFTMHVLLLVFVLVCWELLQTLENKHPNVLLH